MDLLPVIRRDYNLDNYKLKTVSTLFIGATKDPLTHKDIFKSYEDGVKFKTGNKSLGICGKYCVQDSYLVLKLFEKLQLWYGLTEQANIFNVPIPYLYTKGQQIKVYSQIYKLCIKNSIVLESDVYKVLDTDFCQGASVLDVIAGIHNNVTSFDFQSLYPSIIIAYNIDPTTLLKDDVKMDDNKCNIIEWEEHLGCQHDKKIIRKMELTSYIDKEHVSQDRDEQKLYELIRFRTLGSQMADAKVDKTDVKIEISNSTNFFEAHGEVIIFDGFMKLYKNTSQSLEDVILPPLEEGKQVASKEIQVLQRYSKPLARFTEATLVKKLEELVCYSLLIWNMKSTIRRT